MKKKIGIIGGMGPLATCKLFELIISFTKAGSDKENIRVLIDNNPQIPDRTAAILSGGEDPVPELTHSGQMLADMGADFLLVPCNTAHHFLPQVRKNVSCEILDMIDLTSQRIAQLGIHRIGLLATSGTVNSCVYDGYLHSRGIELIKPPAEAQQAVMDCIYKKIKAFDFQGVDEIVEKNAQLLLNMGAEAVILGCTELSLVNLCHSKILYVDPLRVLAENAVRKAGYEVR